MRNAWTDRLDTFGRAVGASLVDVLIDGADLIFIEWLAMLFRDISAIEVLHNLRYQPW